MNVGWPEGIYFALLAFRLIVMAALDGEKRTGKHSLAVTMLDCGIGFGLLYWGGFFA